MLEGGCEGREFHTDIFYVTLGVCSARCRVWMHWKVWTLEQDMADGGLLLKGGRQFP